MLKLLGARQYAFDLSLITGKLQVCYSFIPCKRALVLMAYDRFTGSTHLSGFHGVRTMDSISEYTTDAHVQNSKILSNGYLTCSCFSAYAPLPLRRTGTYS
jgi:hypothetical protein